MAEPVKKKGFLHAHLNFRKDGAFMTYINILIGYLDTVVAVNFFFLLTSVGVITIGPGLEAMNEVFNDIADNRTEKRYRSYFRHFKESFNVPLIVFGLLLAGLMAGFSYAFIFAFMNLNKHSWIVSIMILSVFFMFFLSRFASYVFLQYARMKLSFKQILKNSFYLAAGYPKALVLTDLSFLICIVVPLIFIEYAFPFLLIIGFSLLVLSSMMSVYSIVDHYVIKGEEDEEGEPKEDKPNFRLDLIGQDERKVAEEKNGEETKPSSEKKS
jgi:uncharacterized membrane protein YesL